MTKKHTRDEVREAMRHFANKQRDIADEAARMFDGCDDPHHPWGIAKDAQGNQLFTDWIDFTNKVARPLVEADGDDEAVQRAMALFRKECPYYICVALVMALNRVNKTHPYPNKGESDADPE